jgi:hypothetical protein
MALTAHRIRPSYRKKRQDSTEMTFLSWNGLRGAEMCRNCMFVGFEVLTLLVIMSTIFWDITPCSPLKVNRRSGEALLSAGFSLRIFFDGGDMFL